MALPSQTERGNDGNRSVMAQPESGLSSAARTGLIILGVALVGIAGYAAAKWNTKPGSGIGTGTTGNTASGNAQTAGTLIPKEPALLAPAPVEFTQGQPMPGTTGIQGNTSGVTPFGLPKTPATVARQVTTPPIAGTSNPPISAPGNPGNPGNLNTPTTLTAGDNKPIAGQPTTGQPSAVAQPTTDLTVLAQIEKGDRLLRENKLVDARAAFSKALLQQDASELDRESLRSKLSTMNQDLVFGTMVAAGDPLVESYKVQSGDSLVRIRSKRDLATDWRLIQRVNRIANPNSVRVGQTLKLVRGPFHAVVNKAAYRVDIFAGSPDDPANWLYIKGYRAGLGEGNSTPVGNYTIKKGSKLTNPHWTNPRSGEKFDQNDPKNPIGEFWIGWQGIGDSKGNAGYGFHGTIEPDSIGQQKSMGCVRFANNDIAEIYELLAEEVSVVRVLP